jgi:hypothetical protein
MQTYYHALPQTVVGPPNSHHAGEFQDSFDWSPISTRPVAVRLIALRRRSEAKVEAAAQFGNDTRRGQRRKVDDTHVHHFFGQAQRKSNEVKPGRIDAAIYDPAAVCMDSRAAILRRFME